MKYAFYPKSLRRFPWYGWVGLLLTLVFWILNWFLPGLRTQWGFFPLWLGYCLSVDACVFLRKGHSLLTRNPRGYAKLFLISAFGWWIFEWINHRTQNWIYVGREQFSYWEFAFWATLSFTTVMPAVFGTAELVGCFPWLKKLKKSMKLSISLTLLPQPVQPGTTFPIFFFVIGCIGLVLILFFPNTFYPLIWISLFFILDPLNLVKGRPSLLVEMRNGDWCKGVFLGLGSLICGFFWEMWNYYSYPKWIYHLPFLNSFHIFEMPALGYLGYIPFSWELFALYHVVLGFLKQKEVEGYLHWLDE